MQADTNATSETVESTTTAGLKFLESLKQAKDKTCVQPDKAPPVFTDSIQRTAHRCSLPHASGQGMLEHASTTTIRLADGSVQDEVPDYYEYTKLPIAIDTIEVRLLSPPSQHIRLRYHHILCIAVLE